MGKVFFDISMSVDGFVAGPDATLEDPLGKGGEQLHNWAIEAASWRESHGLEGGEHNVDSDVVAETLARQGAVVMGRGMFGGGAGPWEDDPKANGWWGEEPPFHMPVFVLTHHPREPLELQGGTTFHFVTDGIEVAVERARAAAGDKDVLVAGGGKAVQQALAAGLVDDFQLHVAPLFLGDGVRLFDAAPGDGLRIEQTRVIESPAATHLAYRVVRSSDQDFGSIALRPGLASRAWDGCFSARPDPKTRAAHAWSLVVAQEFK
jgi:dihydrofolate reductase